MLQRELQRIGRPLELARVDTEAGLRAALAAGVWNVAICERSRCELAATAALAIVIESRLDIPFIIVSATVDEDAAVAAMRAGAKDHVPKANLGRLRAVVERELRDAENRFAQRAAEGRVRVQEARFRALIERSSTAITLTDRHGICRYASPALVDLLGYTMAAVIDHPVLDLVMPEDRGTVVAELATLLRAPRAVSVMEIRARHRDGTQRWIEIRTTNLLDDPAILAMVGNIRDITDAVERRTVQAALTDSEARFARLAESGIVGICTSDLMGGIHDANDTFLAMVGRVRSELGTPAVHWNALTPGWESIDAEVVATLKRTGVAEPFERELVRKDGSRVAVLIGVAMLRDEEVIIFIADLSAQKRVEIALRQAESQLRQAQKMEAMGRLAAGVAHDFNNILSVILSYAEILVIDLPFADPLRDAAEEINRAGIAAANLTKQLLLFSRQKATAPTVLDLGAVIQNMTRMLVRLLGADIALHTSSTPNLGLVCADLSHIEQVILNLVVNARDAMPIGGTLTIATSDIELKAGPHVLLTVTDTGIGMDRATRSHIFDPFFTTKPVGQGTGLGLSTVFGVVRTGGGAIEVDSEPGVGTTFRVYLPRVEGVPADPVVAQPLRRGTETILLVEDDLQVRTVVAQILRRSGYTVLDVGDPLAALRLSTTEPGTIHMLVTDVVMPGMSGPELARRIREARPDIAVLCMSGYTDDTIVRHGVVAAKIAFVQKPVTPDMVDRKVREVLDAAKRAP